MPWIELHIKTTGNQAENLSEILIEWGALAVSFFDEGDEPIFEPSTKTVIIWSEMKVVGLFEKDIALFPIYEYLENLRQEGKIKQFFKKDIPDQDWIRASFDSFKPTCFGEKLWVTPSWHEPPVKNALNVILDPGLAFGTGTHPTTHLCLTWLDANPPVQKIVIDYGTGSGILGIAALKLGAKKVLAIDQDPLALQCAKENAIKNQLDATIFTTYPPEATPKIFADLLIANILTQSLIDLAPVFASLTRLGGKIVLSGILAQDAQNIYKIYRKWYSVQAPVFKEDWVLLEGIRANNN